jgi:Chitin synthase export chaperone
VSIGLIAASGLIIFIGSGYIALDTGFSFNSYWNTSLDAPNLHYALYTIYQLGPLVFLSLFFLLESFLVLRILGELRPLGKYPPPAYC